MLFVLYPSHISLIVQVGGRINEMGKQAKSGTIWYQIGLNWRIYTYNDIQGNST